MGHVGPLTRRPSNRSGRSNKPMGPQIRPDPPSPAMRTRSAAKQLANPLNLNQTTTPREAMPLQCLSPSPNVLLRSSYANSNRQCHVTLDRRPGAGARVCCVAGAKPKRKVDVAKLDREAEELVTMLMCKFSDKEPLVKTLNKYVRIVRTDHCFRLFEELGKTDKWIQCLEVFRWMQRQRWYIADNGVYSKLISVMGKKGQTRMAMWLFSEMRNSGCRPDTSVYNALISAHLHSNDKAKGLAKAMGYFERMKGIERSKPNIVTYNILLRAFASGRNVEQVDALFKDLGEGILTPDIFTFNGVMDAYGKNGMIREMEDMLSRMKSDQCKPDIITFNLLIDSYGKRQEFDKMEQVFKSLLCSKEKPTMPTFNSMIINYGKARLREKAESVFNKMISMKYVPNYITHESLIMTFGYCDYISKARDVFDGLIESGKELKISTLNAMLDAYCMNGLTWEADALFEDSRSMGVVPHSSTYKLLYKAYTKAQNKELIVKLLKHMERDGVVPNKRFFLDSLGTFASQDDRPKRVDASSRESQPNVTAKT